ncbi:hypothetical protein L195_g030771 [Trifolium pratense]|uniref:Transposase MuDR plant domain-containing protein n=1 Tax=Trifolium pratense TaxID=57577 RepID=A0A2K3L8K2_TRIPR|nr:hypothetical protein L195_g028747 [Trifolium pratense]PNX74843.1 hypothetical protein L195_g030771 [Trifolium pratense]
MIGDPESARRMSTDEGYDFAEKVGVGGMTKEEESDSFYNYHSEELKTPISSSDDEQVDGPKQPVFPRFCEVAKFGFLCLELEMLFTNLSSFKTAVKDYTIHLQREIKWVKNDKTRARAKCKQQDCKWEIFCSWKDKIRTEHSLSRCEARAYLKHVPIYRAMKWVRELVEASEDTSQSATASQPVQPQQDIPANELAYASVGDNVPATPSE